MTTATVAPPNGNGFAVLLCMFLLVSAVTVVVLWIHERRSDVQTARSDTHDEQLAGLAYRLESLLEYLGLEVPDPVEDDSPAALLAEPHLRGLTGSAEDLANLLPRRPAGLRVSGLSGNFPAERGVEDLQGVQGVQLARDVAEVVGQSVEDRGAEFVTDGVLVPVADHEVSEDVAEPAQGLSGAVVAAGVVVDGESGDRHSVKDGLTSPVCQEGLDADTDEFPAVPPTEPDGIAIQVQSALIEARDLSDERPHPVDSAERKAKNAAEIEEALKRFTFTGGRK